MLFTSLENLNTLNSGNRTFFLITFNTKPKCVNEEKEKDKGKQIMREKGESSVEKRNR